jgi:ABC-type Mn2+/Zn2+ transport system ATPase subunit
MNKKSSLCFSSACLGYRKGAFGASTSTILENISFQLESGQVGIIYGGNGAGKTTLLKAAAGLLNPLKGGILIGSRKPKECLISYLPQAKTVFPWKRAIADASFFLESCEMSDMRRLLATARVMKSVGFNTSYRKKVYQLSGGQQQKVAISRSLACSSFVDLVILDEPTQSLDVRSKKVFLRNLPQLIDQIKCPVLIATHDKEVENSIPCLRFSIKSKTIKEY